MDARSAVWDVIGIAASVSLGALVSEKLSGGTG
jgi:hypothetical protein